jgi:hypothetical protein
MVQIKSASSSTTTNVKKNCQFVFILKYWHQFGAVHDMVLLCTVDSDTPALTFAANKNTNTNSSFYTGIGLNIYLKDCCK